MLNGMCKQSSGGPAGNLFFFFGEFPTVFFFLFFSFLMIFETNFLLKETRFCLLDNKKCKPYLTVESVQFVSG